MPILIYDGKERWERPLSVTEMMDLPPMLARHQPRFDFLALKVKWADREELAGSRHPFAWLVRAIQELDAPFEELVAVLRKTMGELETLAAEDRVAWERVLSFLYYLVSRQRGEEERDVLVEEMAEAVQVRKRREEAVVMGRTIWDAAIEEGMARGIERGIVKGREEGIEKGIDLGLAEGLVRGATQAKQDDVLLFLSERFGPLPEALVEHVRAVHDPGVLDDLVRQAARAETLDSIRF